MNISQRTQRQKIVLVCVSILSIIIGVVEGACSSSCISCVNDTCEICQNGTYLDSTRDCLTCPSMCTSCGDGSYCYTCTAGYFKRTCTNPCTSQHCVNNECDIDGGQCIFGCTDGYFQSGAYCYRCNTRCNTCENFSNNCTQCKIGNYGVGCQQNCSHCKDGLCSKDSCTYGCVDGFFQVLDTCISCINQCTSCSAFENCHACHVGYWGPSCQYTCTECITCNQDDGSCRQPGTTKTTTTPQVLTENTTVTEIVKTSRHVQYTSDPEMITETPSTISEISKNNITSDDNGLLYAAVIGWVFVAILIGVIVLGFVVYRYRVISNKGQPTASNDVTTDRVLTSHDYTSLDMRTRREDENQYSMLQNPEPVVTIATSSSHNTGLQDTHVPERTLEHLPGIQQNGQCVGSHYMNT